MIWRRLYLWVTWQALMHRMTIWILAPERLELVLLRYWRRTGAMDRFHVTSSLSKIQNWRAKKVFILIRHKRRLIYICFQFYSSIRCFVWKQDRFEIQSYGGCVSQGYYRVCSVKKYIIILWFWTFLDVKALEKVLMKIPVCDQLTR